MYRLNNYLEPIIQINHSDYVQKLLFTPDEKILISQSYNDIKFWDVKIKKLLRTIEGDFSFLHDISISPDAKILAGGCEYIKFWDIDTGKLINIISGDFDWINNIVFTPDGNHVAVLTLRMNDFYDSDDALIINDTNELLDFVRLELWDINEKKRIWSKKIISEPSFLDCTEDGWLVYNDDNVIQLLNFRNVANF
jgi:WD40 repeat protein